MSAPPPYDESIPPHIVAPERIRRLRPIGEWPHDGLGRVFVLAWQDQGVWMGMHGRFDAVTGRFVADVVVHRTNALPRTPTHFVDDRVNEVTT